MKTNLFIDKLNTYLNAFYVSGEADFFGVLVDSDCLASAEIWWLHIATKECITAHFSQIMHS